MPPLLSLPKEKERTEFLEYPPFGKVGGIPMSRQERTVDKMEGYKTANWFVTSECFILAFLAKSPLTEQGCTKKGLVTKRGVRNEHIYADKG